MGEAVKRGVNEGLWERQDLVLTTKLFFGVRAGVNNKGLSRKHLIEGLLASLDRMGLEYVDVVMAHRPDPVTPIEEVVRAFAWAIDNNKVRDAHTQRWLWRQLRCARPPLRPST